MKVEAYNDAGVVSSGIGTFIMAMPPAKPADPYNDPSVTDDTKIKVFFGTTLPANNGATIVGMQLQMDNGMGGDFSTIVGATRDVLQTSIVISTGIVKGRFYRFRYRCKNINGWSDYSNVVSI